MAQPAASGRKPFTRGVVTILLIVAIGGALVVPIYARSLPKLGDFPFFYWYQLVWVPVVAVACWLCYVLLRTKPAPAARSRNSGSRNSGSRNSGSRNSGAANGGGLQK
jgi:hypothetical protein